MDAASAPRPLIGPIIAIIGGLGLVLGSSAAWVTISEPGSPFDISKGGTETGGGWITVVLGSALLAIGVVSLRNRGRAWAVASAIVGGIGVAVGIWEIVNVRDLAVLALEPFLPPEIGISVEENRAIIELSIERAGASVSAGIGLYLVLMGGTLGVVAGVLQIRSESRTSQAADGGTVQAGTSESGDAQSLPLQATSEEENQLPAPPPPLVAPSQTDQPGSPNTDT